MAGIDHSIYFQQQTPDILGGFAQGYGQGANMRALAEQRQKDQATKQAFSKAMVRNPDGSVSFDSGMAMKNLAGINPEMAYQLHQNEVTQRAAKQKAEQEKKAYEVDQMARALDGVSDEMSFQKTKSLLEARGLKTDVLGPKYDPVRIEGLKRAAIPYQELVKNRFKERELGQKDKQLAIDAKKAIDPSAGLSVGEKSLDKEYGKQYEKYTSKGRANAVNSIMKLKKLQQEVEKDTGFGEAGGTRWPIPDMLRSRTAIERRDDARNFANVTLKELFGGQLSDAEREAAAREFWNDSLDNESNAKRLKGKIKELEDGLKSQDAKARYWEKNRGSLKGFKLEKTEDEKALDWANANKDDPRAEKIFRRLGIGPS